MTITIKADYELDVLGIPFGGPNGGKDTHGEYFDRGTDLGPLVHEEKPIPVIHHHGLTDGKKTDLLGWATKDRVDNQGVWFKVVLDDTKQLSKKIISAAKDGYARASSGALSHLADGNRNGRLSKWWVGEMSLMDSREYAPANNYAVALPTLKSHYELAGMDLPPLPDSDGSPVDSTEAVKSADTDEGIDPVRNDSPIGEETSMTSEEILVKISEMIGSAMAPVVKAAKMDDEEHINEEDDEEAKKAVTAKAAEIVQLDSAFAQLTEDNADEIIKPIVDRHMKTLTKEYFDAYYTKRREREETIRKQAEEAKKAYMKSVPGEFKSDAVGGVKANGARVTNMIDRRYAHLKADDMALGAIVAQKRGIVLGEDYYRHLAHKSAEFAQSNPLKSSKENFALKAALPFKADEINATNIAGQGTEWVGEFYSTTLWDKARDAQVLDRLLAKGMLEQEIPQGYESAYFPTEGADPIVYTAPQANDVDSTGRIEVTANVQALGTARVQLTPKELKTAVAISDIQNEDSLINMVSQANRQLNTKMQETLTQLAINGDTEAAANTNINLIDGTPPTGTNTPYYIASDGILKYPLVTNTAQANDFGGALTINTSLNAKSLLSSAVRARRDQLLYLIDPDTEDAHLALNELKTVDVAGRFATIQAGEILKLWGVDVVSTGFMELANAAGKTSSTPSNNTLGRIAVVYAPFWGMGWKRRINLETGRDILAGADIIVASMRVGFVERGADAAAIQYNITV